ncbi:hypothetical protein PMAYCL1PPCAC_00849, partial [Pristionchus mayeri]
DAFIISANSLDINAVYDKVTQDETVHLQVDKIPLDFFGTDTLTRQLKFEEAPFQFAIAIQWDRKTTAASWAVQLDFVTTSPVAEVTTTSAAIPTRSSASTTPKIEITTTSSGFSLP